MLPIILLYFPFLCLQATGFDLTQRPAQPCDTAEHGYRCFNSLSHNWGQYSPYFSVPSNVSAAVPDQCNITFVQLLSRHGARDPTASKTAQYSALIDKIHGSVPAQNLQGKYSFFLNYTYTLGADQLTSFGQQEMVNSGIKFFSRYPSLTASSIPFIRASSEDRVVESAQNFTQGFHSARLSLNSSIPSSDPAYPYPILIITESSNSNNTLDHSLCTAFESGAYSNISGPAQAAYASTFIPSVQARLNNDLPGANLTSGDVISMMDLCPFTTIAPPYSSSNSLSPFCDLFNEDEWRDYDYYQTLGKYYGYSIGNPLGPTQGVGWARELLARLTADRSYVTDEGSFGSSINHTLDASNETFPLGGGGVGMYADFSHDNDMTAALAALGLYNLTATGGLLSNVSRDEPGDIGGYSAAWTVPFAARVYVEKMACVEESELVRVIVNDRVVDLGCGDEEGRCRLGEWVDSLKFVKSGGSWDQCFT